MATYTDLIQRSTSGTDPLVPQPLKGRKMATPDAATMKKLVQQGKAMPAPGQDRPGRFNIRNGGELDDAIKAVGRVPAAGRPKVRKFIMARADALKLTSKIPDTWNADGTLKDGSDGDSSDSDSGGDSSSGSSGGSSSSSSGSSSSSDDGDDIAATVKKLVAKGMNPKLARIFATRADKKAAA